jgi:hypothetical protein
MYLRVSHFQFNSSRYAELLPLIQQISGALQGLPGNQDVHVGINRTAGSGNVVSTWDTLEHASFPRETAPTLGEVVRKLLALGMQIDPPEIGEMVV